MPLAPAPTPAKPAKITPAICRIATRKAKRRKSAKARAIVAKKEGLRRSKRTAGSNAGRYTTNSSLIANKDNNNNAYNRAYIPPTNTEKEEGSSSNDNSVNGSTSNSTNKGEGGGMRKRGEGASRYKDYLNNDIEMEDCQTTTLITAKETAIGTITIAPIASSSSAPSTINVPIISAPFLTNVIEEGLLEEAKKQHPIARQPRRPIRRGAIGLSTNSNSNSSNSNNSNNTPSSRPYYKRREKKAIL
ncbi:hypothetical protein P8C59_000039 [Phyllachora maydis]|uniref:Uncharacterized protein n=1 Tax=Phyllachora maydis TaxID=1825666 RepID=A0AAD9HWC1_9PEZI|nr:hypothetical protein P8C59_000039 [Phyllachora maydis]